MNKYLYYFLVFCFVFSNSVFGVGGNIWQNIALALFLIIIISQGVDKVEISMLLFLLCCVVSIVVNDIPVFFKPYERFAQYLLVVVAVSPLIRSSRIDFYRMKLLELVFVSFGILTIGSFVYKLMGAGITTLGYWGLALHPNFLGFFSMISCISLFILLFLYRKRTYKIVVGGLCIISFLTLMLSAARICLVGSVIGCLVFVGLRYKDRFLKLVLSLVLLVGMAIATFPLYKSYLSGILYKQEAAKSEESTTSSRDGVWATRLEEIHRYPVFGVGCFSVDTSIEDDDIFFNPYNPLMGNVELGSTYLGVMSQTGLLGFTFFAIILFIALFRCYMTMKETDSVVPIGLLALSAGMAVHMVVEGYAVQAGSMQCVFLWLLISCMMVPADIMEEEEGAICQQLRAYDEDDDNDDDDLNFR